MFFDFFEEQMGAVINTDENILAEEEETAIASDFTEDDYPAGGIIFQGLSGPGHVHPVICDYDCYKALQSRGQVLLTTEDDDGHNHKVLLELGGDGGAQIKVIECDDRLQTMEPGCYRQVMDETVVDPHSDTIDMGVWDTLFVQAN